MYARIKIHLQFDSENHIFRVVSGKIKLDSIFLWEVIECYYQASIRLHHSSQI